MARDLLAGNPAVLEVTPRTGGFASPSPDGFAVSAGFDLTKAIFHRNPDNPVKTVKRLYLKKKGLFMHFDALPKRAVPHQDLRWIFQNLENRKSAKY
jgi:hypothetical protein